jgi:hypothetical protein
MRLIDINLPWFKLVWNYERKTVSFDQRSTRLSYASGTSEETRQEFRRETTHWPFHDRMDEQRTVTKLRDEIVVEHRVEYQKRYRQPTLAGWVAIGLVALAGSVYAGLHFSPVPRRPAVERLAP